MAQDPGSIPRDADRPLVVGAGPVGLAAALFLHREGRAVRLIDAGTGPSPHSKALAVNPRTLDLLEPTGVTDQMLRIGARMRGAQLHRRGRILAELPFAGIHARYPFMLALSQATSERLLEQALVAAGGTVERGTRMVACRTVAAPCAEAELERNVAGGAQSASTVRCPWLLAADGAHSTARQQLGIDFDGTTLPEPWHLADVPLRTDLSPEHAHVFFMPGGGFQFLLRVVDDSRPEGGAAPLWRVLGDRPDPLRQLQQAEVAAPPIWESSFHIAHRLASVLSSAQIHLAGDAAHLHSPVGARGMNLGIEDAWVFARLACAGQLHRYDALRRPVDGAVVRRVEAVSRAAISRSPIVRCGRAALLPLVARIPFARRKVLAVLAGLDHELADPTAQTTA